jgi:hypothetical protein
MIRHDMVHSVCPYTKQTTIRVQILDPKKFQTKSTMSHTWLFNVVLIRKGTQWGGGAQHASKDQEWRTHWVDATEHAGREPVDGKTNDLEWPCSLDTQKTSSTACYINADLCQTQTFYRFALLWWPGCI